MEPDEPPRYPRDKETLLRDFTVAGRLADIRKTARLREQLSPKWWEAVVGLVQFAAALGLIAAVILHPAVRHDPYGRLLSFWMTLMILALVMGFEFMIWKLFHLRRAFELQIRRLDDLSRRLDALEKETEPEK
ncbi:MAG: hypothetical protein M1457_10700 [bacterium]|nr:hypothetical protein [bacterium]